MKKYTANKELENILLLNGFIDTSSKEDNVKGKKRFKTTKSSRKEIYFDYINIIVFYRSVSHESYLSLTEEELRVLLLYFKITSTDYQELSSIKGLRIKEVTKRIGMLEDEKEQLVKYNFRKARVGKLTRVLELYKAIQIE